MSDSTVLSIDNSLKGHVVHFWEQNTDLVLLNQIKVYKLKRNAAYTYFPRVEFLLVFWFSLAFTILKSLQLEMKQSANVCQ